MHDCGPMNVFWSHFHGDGDEMGVWFVVGVMVVFSMICIYFPLDIDKKPSEKEKGFVYLVYIYFITVLLLFYWFRDQVLLIHSVHWN